MQTTITGSSKVNVEKAFPDGIKYTPPGHLVHSSGINWEFQPHPKLYKILAENVLNHYNRYKKDEIDKNCIPAYFYLAGAGTGKSRHGSEFASSIQKAITFHSQHPFYKELAERLEKAF